MHPTTKFTWKEEQLEEQKEHMLFPSQLQVVEPSEILSALLENLLQA